MSRLVRAAAAALSLALAVAVQPAMAQASASPTKKALVQKILDLNKPGIESVGTELAGQTANQALQAAAPAVGRLPADKREAVAADIQAEVRKFYDETAPMLRERAVAIAPSAFGSALEDKLSEDELRAVVAWLESPVSRKYQQLTGEVQQALLQKLIADTRGKVEPRLKALDQTIAGRLKSASATPKPAASDAKK